MKIACGVLIAVATGTWFGFEIGLQHSARQAPGIPAGPRPRVPRRTGTITTTNSRGELVGTIDCYQAESGRFIPDGKGTIFRNGSAAFRVRFERDQLVEAEEIGNPLGPYPDLEGHSRLDMLMLFLGADDRETTVLADD